jgi:hypothetical protein
MDKEDYNYSLILYLLVPMVILLFIEPAITKLALANDPNAPAVPECLPKNSTLLSNTETNKTNTTDQSITNSSGQCPPGTIEKMMIATK